MYFSKQTTNFHVKNKTNNNKKNKVTQLYSEDSTQFRTLTLIPQKLTSDMGPVVKKLKTSKRKHVP